MENLSDFTLNHWTWFILLLGFLGLEMAVPGVIFLWLALSAAAMGVFIFAVPDVSWEVQCVIYTILSIISVLLGKRYVKMKPVVSDDENLNKRGTQYIDHTYVISKDLINGEGKIRIGDTLWQVRGTFDAAIGDKVKVVGVDGTVLIVEKA